MDNDELLRQMAEVISGALDFCRSHADDSIEPPWMSQADNVLQQWDNLVAQGKAIK